MLEGVLTSLFNSVLGPYVENVDGSQFRCRLFTGALSLSNICLKPDALAKLLDLPVRIVAGRIGSIKIDVPLSGLRSKPIVVTLDEVYALVAPDYSAPCPPLAAFAATKSKYRQLANIEASYVAAQQRGGGGGALGRMGTGSANVDDARMFEGFLATAVANIQVRITRVHIRYEHPLSIAMLPGRGGLPVEHVRSVVGGVSIAELSVSTTNERWSVEFVRAASTVYKVGVMQGLSLYADTRFVPYEQSVLYAMECASPAMTAHLTARTIAARRAAAQRNLNSALDALRIIFETQAAEKQIRVQFPSDASPKVDAASPPPPPPLPSQAAAAESRAALSSTAYAYILQPVSATVRASIALGYPLDRPKVSATVDVEGIHLQLVDRQYSMLMRVALEHAQAWEARNLGIPYPWQLRPYVPFTGPPPTGGDALLSSSAASLTTTSTKLGGATSLGGAARSRRILDLDSDEDAGMSLRTRSRPALRAAAVEEDAAAAAAVDSDEDDGPSRARPPRTPPASSSLPPAASSAVYQPSPEQMRRRRWKRVLYNLCVRHRAALQERARHEALAAYTVEYTRLYLKRLTAGELLGLAPLTSSERRRYHEIENDPILTFDDILALRRAAEQWVRAQLHLPMLDVSRRRAEEVEYFAKVLASANLDVPLFGVPLASLSRSTVAKHGGPSSTASSAAPRSGSGKAGAAAAGGGNAGGAASNAQLPGHFARMFGRKAGSGGASKKSSAASGSSLASSDAAAVGSSRRGGASGGEDGEDEGDGGGGGGGGDEIAAALAAMTSDDYAKLYDALGYKYNPDTGTAQAREGAEVSNAAAEAAKVANNGLPRDYVWLSLCVEVRTITLEFFSLLLASQQAASGGGSNSSGSGAAVGGASRSLRKTIQATLPGSMAACGTQQLVSRMSVSQSSIGLDMKASSLAGGVDLGDVTLIDCGPAVTAAGKAVHMARRGLASRRRDFDLAHRYILFSEHSLSAATSTSEGAGAGGASKLSRGLARHRATTIGSQTGKGSAAAASASAAASEASGITEASICDENGVSQQAALAASLAASKRLLLLGSAAADSSIGRAGGAPGLDASSAGSGVGSAAASLMGKLNTGGGGLFVNPVRSGWLSLRYVDNPDAVGASTAPGSSGPPLPGSSGSSVQARSGGAALAPATRAPATAASSRSAATRAYSSYAADSEDEDEEDAARAARGESGSDDDDAEECAYLPRGARGGRARGGATALEPPSTLPALSTLATGGGGSSSSFGAAGGQPVNTSLRVRAVARPLVVVWSPPFVKRALAWVRVADSLTSTDFQMQAPSSVGPDSEPRISAPNFSSGTVLFARALNRFLASMVRNASKSLESALVSERTVMDIKAHIAAPMLVVPQRLHVPLATVVLHRSALRAAHAQQERARASPMLIIDMGSIGFVTRTAPNALAPPPPPPSSSDDASCVSSPRSAGTRSASTGEQPSVGAAPPQPSAPAAAAALSGADAEAAIAGIQPYLATCFDHFNVCVSGISLLLCHRAGVEPSKEYDARLHSRLDGADAVVILQGFAPGAEGSGGSSGGSGGGGGMSSWAAQPSPLAGARAAQREASTPLRSRSDSDPWSVDALGPPRVAWHRGSARYLMRHCSLVTDVYINVSAQEAAPAAALPPAPSATPGGARGVAKTALSPPPPPPPLPLPLSPPLSSSASMRLPSAYLGLRAQHLILSATTSDVVVIANIALTAITPFVAMMQADASAPAQEAATARAAASAGGAVAAAAASLRSVGVFVRVGPVFDALPAEFFAFTNPRALLAATSLATVADARGRERARVGGGVAASTSAAAAVATDARPADAPASSPPGGAEAPLMLLVSMSVDRLTLRLRHLGRSSGGAPPLASQASVFDLILDIEAVRGTVASAADGYSTLALGTQSIVAYLGAGSVARAFLFELAARVTARYAPPRAPGHAGTSALALPSPERRGGARAVVDARVPRCVQHTLLQLSLSNAEVCLVRRQQRLLSQVDRIVFAHLNAAVVSPASEEGGDAEAGDAEAAGVDAPTSPGRKMTATFSPPSGTDTTHVSQTYAATLAEMKADATYLFAPLQAHVVVRRSVQEFDTEPRTASASKIVIRVGSAMFSISPYDAALFMSLARALQEGSVAVIDEITTGLAEILSSGAPPGGLTPPARADTTSPPRTASGSDTEGEEEGDGGGGAAGADDDSSSAGAARGEDDFDPEVADVAAAAMALTVSRSRIAEAAGVRVQRVAASVVANATHFASDAEAGEAAGGAAAPTSASPAHTPAASTALSVSSGFSTSPSALASREGGGEEVVSHFELSLLCDTIQLVIYNNIVAAAAAAVAGASSGGHRTSIADAAEGGLPSYRTQVLRATLSNSLVHVNPASVSLSTRLAVYYFNDAIVAWEPALEPWPFSFTVSIAGARAAAAAAAAGKQRPAHRGGSGGGAAEDDVSGDGGGGGGGGGGLDTAEDVQASLASSLSDAAITLQLRGLESLNITASSSLFAALPGITTALEDIAAAAAASVDEGSGGASGAALEAGTAAGGGAPLPSSSGGGAPTPLAFAPFVLLNETGCAVQVWRPQTGAVLGSSRMFSGNKPMFVSPGSRAPISATFLALQDAEQLEAEEQAAAAAAAEAEGRIGVSTFAQRASSASVIDAARASSSRLSGAGRAEDVMQRAVPMLNSQEEEDADIPPEFRIGAFAPPSGDARRQWYRSTGNVSNADIVSGTVVVTLSLQVAGYKPLLRQAINRASSTHITLQPLDPRDVRSNTISLLRAGAASLDDVSSSAEAMEREARKAARAEEAGGADSEPPLDAWQRVVKKNRDSARLPPLHLELLVEKGVGGCKLIRLRSLLHIHNATRIPIIVRVAPPASAAFTDALAARRAALGEASAEEGDASMMDIAVDEFVSSMYGACVDTLRARVRRVTSSSSSSGGGGGGHRSGGSDLIADKSAFLQREREGGAGHFAHLPPADRHTPGLTVSVGAGRTEHLPSLFDLSCWDAAASGVPIDRALLPGQSWRVPLPYAANSRVFFRPALRVEADAYDGTPVPVCDASDDGRVALRVPEQLQSAVLADPVLAGCVSITAGADASASVSASSPTRTRRPSTLGSVSASRLGGARGVGAELEDVMSTSQPPLLSTGDYFEERDVLAVDPRFGWSAFEVHEERRAHGAEAEEEDGEASAAPGAAAGGAPPPPSRKGMLSFFRRAARSGEEAPSVHTTDAGGASVVLRSGLHMAELSYKSTLQIVQALLDAAAPNRAPAASAASAAGVAASGARAEGRTASLAAHKTLLTTQVAICARARNGRAHGAHSSAHGLSAAPSHSVMGGSSASGGGGGGGGGGSGVGGGDETDLFTLLDAEDVVGRSVLSLLLSQVFYYVATRVELVPVVHAHAVRGPRALVGGASGGVAGGVDLEYPEHVAPIARATAAVMTIVIRAPAEVQNTLGGNVAYEVGLPRALCDTSAPSSGGSAAAAAATPSPGRVAGLFGFGKKKGTPPGSASTPAPAAASVASDASSGEGGAHAHAPLAAGEEAMIYVARGDLEPGQSLSLLFAHPDAMPLSSDGRVPAGARSRYKQRLTAAKYVRALSVRVKLAESGFSWSPWIGLWTPHASAERAAATATRDVSFSATQVLPTLDTAQLAASARTQSVGIVDGMGGKMTLIMEHALTSSVTLLAQHAGASTGASAGASAGAPFGQQGGGGLANTATLSLSVFCRFWLLNATGLPLLYSSAVRAEDASHLERGSRMARVAAGQAQPVVEETYENQRFVMFKWSAKLLPTDRSPWSDRYGLHKEVRTPDSFQLPTPEWRWTSPWVVDMQADVDDDGWQYHVDFPRGGDAGWSAKRGAMHLVRRRRWVRTRLPPTGNEDAQAALASIIECGNPFLHRLMGAEEEVATLAPADRALAARAPMLLAMGVYLYGPEEGAEEQCCVRVGDSDWSLPFQLRSLGRPGVVTVRDRPAERDALSEATRHARRKLQHQYDLVVSARPATELTDAVTRGTLGAARVFHHTVLVTLSPRYLFVNHLDANIAAFYGSAAGQGASPESGIMQQLGCYVLQVAQAGEYEADGAARPMADVQHYLASIAPATQMGAELEYDVGHALDARLRLMSASAVWDEEEGGRNYSARVTAKASTVPYVLSVPPGEHAPFHWLAADGTPGATNRVCVRVVRLMAQAKAAAAAATAAAGSSARGGGGGGGSRRSSAVSSDSAGSGSARDDFHTIAVPVSQWSGALDLSQVADVPLRLPPAPTSLSRFVGGSRGDIILRMSVRAHRARGTALIVATCESGLLPCAALLAEGAEGAGEEEEEGGRASAPATAAAAAAAVAAGGAPSSSAGVFSSASYAPLMWSTGYGEVTPFEVMRALEEAGEAAPLTLLASPEPDSPVLPLAAARVGAGGGSGGGSGAPLFRVDNHTLDAFVISQRGVRGEYRPPLRIPPRSTVVFGWDEPCLPLAHVAADTLALATSGREGGKPAAARNKFGALLSMGSAGGPSKSLPTAGAGVGVGVGGGTGAPGSSGDAAGGGGGGGPAAAASAGGALSRTIVRVAATTVPLSKSGAGSTSSSGSGRACISGALDIDLSNVSQSASMALAVGRVAEEHALDSAPAAPTGRAAAAQPLLYGRQVLLQCEACAHMWTVDTVREMPCAWELPARQHAGARAAGAFILGTHCRLAALAADGSIDRASMGAFAASAQYEQVPVLFENVSPHLHWRGLAPAAGAAARAPRRRPRASTAVLHHLQRGSGGGAGTSATRSSARHAAAASDGSSMRFGDIVMVRYDALLDSSVKRADVSAVTGEIDEGAQPVGSMQATQTCSLYLVALKSGQLVWLQQEAAEAVVDPALLLPPSARGGEPPACSAFLVVGGAPGAKVYVRERAAKPAAAATASGGRTASRGAASGTAATAYGSEDEHDDSGSDGGGGGGARGGSGLRGGSRAGGGGRGVARAFALVPIAYPDRLLESAALSTLVAPSARDADDAATAAHVLRQCRLPITFASFAASPAPRGGGDASPAGGRVMSNMQRKRLLARGIAVDAEVMEMPASIPFPDSSIPPQLRLDINSEQLPTLSALQAAAGSGGDRPRSSTGAEAEPMAAMAVSDAAVSGGGGGGDPPASAAAGAQASRAAPLTTAAALISKMYYFASVPPSCRISACALSAQTLPARVIAARVGFDGPTRVLTLQSYTGGESTRKRMLNDAALDSRVTELTEAHGSVRSGVPPKMASLMSMLTLQINVHLPSATLSLVDAFPQEIVLVGLDGVACSVTFAHPYVTAEVVVEEVAVDNQIPGALYPVLLSRNWDAPGALTHAGTGAAARRVAARPFLQASLVYQSHASGSGAAAGGSSGGGSVLHFPYLSILLQAMDVAVEEVLLRRIMILLPSSARARDDDGESDDEDADGGGGAPYAGAVTTMVGMRSIAAAHGGTLSTAFSGVRDTLAAHIVRKAAAGRRHDSALLPRSTAGARRSSGLMGALALQRRVHQLSRGARRYAARDLARIQQLQRVAARVVSGSASTVRTAVAAPIRAVEAQMASRSGGGGGGGGVSTQRAATGEVRAMSGPAGALRRGSAASHAQRHGLSEQLAEIASSAPTAAFAGAGSRSAAPAAALGSAGEGRGGVAAGAGEGVDVSDAVDTVGSLAVDVQWWWPGHLPTTHVRSDAQPVQLYVQHMVLNSISANVSFMRDPLCVQAASSLTSLTSPVSVVLNAVGLMALSLNRVPLRLNGLELINVLADQSDLVSRIGQHYVSASLAEMYKVVFASELLGNPVGVVTALGTGMKDFFVEPAQGLVRSPMEFGRGVVRGTGSLLRHTIVGVGVGVGSLASTVSRGVATLAFDADYLRDRAEREARRTHQQPAHLGASLLAGTQELGRGMVQGIAGVVLDPLRGAEEDGAAGFVKGVGRGLAGLVVKPVAGVLDMAARTTEGIVATAKRAGGESAAVATYRRRHQRLLWGIDRAIIPSERVHSAIIAIMSKALEVAAEAAAPVAGRSSQGGVSSAGAAAAAAVVAATPGSSGALSGGAVRRADAARSGASWHANPAAGGGVMTDMRNLATGREAALRAALNNIGSSYMHHILWPHSPYLLIITSRAIIFARINRAAAGIGARAASSASAGASSTSSAAAPTHSPHLCWQSPVVTQYAISAAASASLTPQVATSPHARGAASSAHAASGAASAAATAMMALQDEGDASSGSLAYGRRGRNAAAVGYLTGHVAFTNLIDIMSDMAASAVARAEVDAATAASSGAGAGAGLPSGTGGGNALVVTTTKGRGRTGTITVSAPCASVLGSVPAASGAGVDRTSVRIRPTPLTIMSLDALVRRNFESAGGLPPTAPLFALPDVIVSAMTTEDGPGPLFFADAIATMANVRADVSPKGNVESITLAIGHAQNAATMWRNARLEWLEKNGADDAFMLRERSRLSVFRNFDADHLTPLFMYMAAKSFVDKPVLCAVLMRMWSMQEGLHITGDGYAETLFFSACVWASGLSFGA